MDLLIFERKLMKNPPKTRVCNKCGKRKALILFKKNKEGRFGYSFICKDCQNEIKRKHRKENPEIYKEYDKKKYIKARKSILKRAKIYYIKNKAKKLAYVKEYAIKNKLKIAKQKKIYRAKLKKKQPWLFHLKSAKERCNNPNVVGYISYGKLGIRCLLSKEDIKYLWFRDKAWLLKQPSIDRIDNYKSYTLENCRFIELLENCKHQTRRRNKKL